MEPRPRDAAECWLVAVNPRRVEAAGWTQARTSQTRVHHVNRKHNMSCHFPQWIASLLHWGSADFKPVLYWRDFVCLVVCFLRWKSILSHGSVNSVVPVPAECRQLYLHASDAAQNGFIPPGSTPVFGNRPCISGVWLLWLLIIYTFSEVIVIAPTRSWEGFSSSKTRCPFHSAQSLFIEEIIFH